MSTMLIMATEVAQKHGMTIGDLRSISRTAPVALARQEAYATIYATDRYSLPQIGRFFKRDHTTVLHGIRRHAGRQEAPE